MTITPSQLVTSLLLMFVIGVALGCVLGWYYCYLRDERIRHEGMGKNLGTFELEIDQSQFSRTEGKCGRPTCAIEGPHDHLDLDGRLRVTKCPVPGCQIRGPHSHADALINKIRGE